MLSMGNQTIELWRMERVTEVTGLSRSEIYRRIASGKFPAPRKYRDCARTYWLSYEVEAWVREEIGMADEYDALLG